MKIQFNQIPAQQLDNFKGGNLYIDARMHVDSLNRIMNLRLIPGASIGTHTHTDSSEIMFITSGNGRVIIDGNEEILHPATATIALKAPPIPSSTMARTTSPCLPLSPTNNTPKSFFSKNISKNLAN